MKLETDFSSSKNSRTGRPKSALSVKNIARVKRKFENSPRRSTRTLKLSTTVWRARVLRKS